MQDFYPTPSTASTCMFYTGLDPFTMKEVYVPKDAKEKIAQRKLMEIKKPSHIQSRSGKGDKAQGADKRGAKKYRRGK